MRESREVGPNRKFDHRDMVVDTASEKGHASDALSLTLSHAQV